jgi:RNA polymerase sigma-70 factor (ECF subfamily)
MADRDFDDFYTSQYGRLVVQLYAVTGSLPDAEDAVQEAFARASVHWGRVRAYELPEAWIRRVALNVAFTGLRRARRVMEC